MSAILIYLIFTMLAVLWLDVTRYIIPNWLVGSLLALYPVAVMTSSQAVDWRMALVGMTVVLVSGYIVFALKWMGGGDIKLLTACALWVGLRNLADFIMIVAMIGGAFSLLVWLARKVLPLLPQKFDNLPRLLRNGEPVPYGVAIAFGFLVALLNGKASPL